MPMPGGAQRQPSSYLQGGQGLESPVYGVPQLTGHTDSLLGCLTTFMWLRSSSVLSTKRTVWLEGIVWKSSGSPTQRRALLWDANARSLTSACMLAGNAQCPITVARKGLVNTPNRKQGLFVQ